MAHILSYTSQHTIPQQDMGNLLCRLLPGKPSSLKQATIPKISIIFIESLS